MCCCLYGIGFFKMAIKLKRRTMWITLFVITLVLAALSFTRFEIRKEVVIEASPPQVWSTIIDFQHYDRWNTQLEFLSGQAKPGGKLHLRLSVDGAAPYEFKPAISHWEEHEKLAWLAITGFPRVFDGEHFFELKGLEGDKTLLVNREEYRGVLSLIMKHLPMMEKAPEGFEKMNQELKNYIENEK